MLKGKTQVLSFMAVAIALNVIGANLALFLRLPIYMDMLGTLTISMLFGPWLGALTALLSALISWTSTDIFALFYAPVAILTSLICGFLAPKTRLSKNLFWQSLILSLPGTLVASLITVLLFKGITSSGSSLLVQALHGLGFNMPLSVILVQSGTDYLDRLISLFFVVLLVKSLMPRSFPSSLRS
ncbi:ECF transporter S component [Streptococcus dysgalactiae]|uniref:ECF transporter S component n=1 Tax=Streptococcus dysgalactiae TaxID=1334 RepID=UPI003F5417C8